MPSPALAAPQPPTLDEALAARLSNTRHWLGFAANRLEYAGRHPESAPAMVRAALHFVELAIEGVEP